MKKHMVERIQDLYVGIDNDLSARREHGKTPKGNELNGCWVLRDSEGNWIDHDQYRSDLFSRHGILEVETGHLLDTVSKYKARIAELEAELAALKASAPTPSNPGELAPATPWYPDDSGEWVEVPEDLMEMPKELKAKSLISVLFREERRRRSWESISHPANAVFWIIPPHFDTRIVAYKVVKP